MQGANLENFAKISTILHSYTIIINNIISVLHLCYSVLDWIPLTKSPYLFLFTPGFLALHYLIARVTQHCTTTILLCYTVSNT